MLEQIYYMTEGLSLYDIFSNQDIKRHVYTKSEVIDIINEYYEEIDKEKLTADDTEKLEKEIIQACEEYDSTLYRITKLQGVTIKVDLLYDALDPTDRQELEKARNELERLSGLYAEKESIKDSTLKDELEVISCLNVLTLFRNEYTKEYVWNIGIYREVIRALFVKVLESLPKDKQLTMFDIHKQLDTELTDSYETTLDYYEYYKNKPLSHDLKICIKKGEI